MLLLTRHSFGGIGAITNVGESNVIEVDLHTGAAWLRGSDGESVKRPEAFDVSFLREKVREAVELMRGAERKRVYSTEEYPDFHAWLQSA